MVPTNLIAGLELRYSGRIWVCEHGAGEGEGGVNWEIRFDINTLPRVKQIASRKQLPLQGA